MADDIVRVLRIVQYVGPRIEVERQILNSIHGVKKLLTGVEITANTLGNFPEILREKEER